MRFEHILQVYWSKGFFFAGKLYYTNKLNYKVFFTNNLYGLNKQFTKVLTQRLELTTYSRFLSKTFFLQKYLTLHFKNYTKTINVILSQINNVNATVEQLQKINILRKYLIKSYQGYAHFTGKPVRGQRTWSNS